METIYEIQNIGKGVIFSITPSNLLFISNDLTRIKTFQDFKFIKKGFNNVDLVNFEVGDIFEGWVSEGVYSIHSVWDGTGALNDEASFEHKQTIEY